MKKGLVSIIVPCYNVEQYLDRCIYSLIHQTYSNIAIIMVDDGSTDKTGKICDMYESQDDRIKVIHKQNGGLSDARNVGLSEVNGEYVFFVDSDDEIYENCIELHVRAIEHEKADFTVSEVKLCGSRSVVLRHIDKNINVCNPFDAFLKRKWSVSAWNKLYSASFIKEHKLSFIKGLLHEDILWSLSVSKFAKKVAVVDFPTYKYIIRRNSITTKNVNKKKIDSLMYILQRLEEEKITSNNCSELWNRYIDYWRFYTAINMLRYNGLIKEKMKYYKEIQKINKEKSTCYSLFLCLPYIAFCFIFKPILIFYKFLQKK